jgi:hypothetical protein
LTLEASEGFPINGKPRRPIEFFENRVSSLGFKSATINPIQVCQVSSPHIAVLAPLALRPPSLTFTRTARDERA